MRQYNVTIVGKSPLLMHWDNIQWAEQMKKWREVPENKKLSVAGDDRSPAWTWLGSLYHDGEHVAIPQDNLMRCIMEGAASVLVPGGKNGKTFKAQSQSGMMFRDLHCPLLVDGKAIPIKSLNALVGNNDFQEHEKAAADAGFVLFVKRAKIGSSKHIRVRPQFFQWEAHGVIDVEDEQITENVLRDMLKVAGNYKGLGDWRPSSRTPGPFGRFEAKISKA